MYSPEEEEEELSAPAGVAVVKGPKVVLVLELIDGSEALPSICDE